VESRPQLHRFTIVTILTYRVPSLHIIPTFLFFVFFGLQQVFPWHSPSQLVTVIFFFDLQLFSSINDLCFALGNAMEKLAASQKRQRREKLE
jgi:Ca2+/H+ antiporter